MTTTSRTSRRAVDDGHDLVIAIGFLIAAGWRWRRGDRQRLPGRRPVRDRCDCGVTSPGALPNAVGLLFPSRGGGVPGRDRRGADDRRPGTVSTVGGMKIPPVDNWIAGFQQGAKDDEPGHQVLNGYSQDFVDQAKCKEIALDQISQGSDVVFQVAGGCGLGALDAAGQKGSGPSASTPTSRSRRPHPHERAEAASRSRSSRRSSRRRWHFDGGDEPSSASPTARRRARRRSRRVPQEVQDDVEAAEGEDHRRGDRDPGHGRTVAETNRSGGAALGPPLTDPSQWPKPPPRAPRHHQAIPGSRGERPRRLRPRARRGARAPRRERSRQVDADEHPLRAVPPRRGRDLSARASGRIGSPRDAIDLGIGMVHQHFMLIPVMTVAENIVLGVEPRRGPFLDLERGRERVRELSRAVRAGGRPERPGRGDHASASSSGSRS